MPRVDEINKASGKKSAAVVAAEAKASRFDDPEVQDEIREPKALAVKIGGAEVKIHALSAKKSREVSGLWRLVLADTLGGDASSIKPVRMVGVLLSSYESRALAVVATALFPVGSANDAVIAAKVAEIDELISSQELADAFLIICDREGVFKQFIPSEAADSAPK